VIGDFMSRFMDRFTFALPAVVLKDRADNGKIFGICRLEDVMNMLLLKRRLSGMGQQESFKKGYPF